MYNETSEQSLDFYRLVKALFSLVARSKKCKKLDSTFAKFIDSVEHFFRLKGSLYPLK